VFYVLSRATDVETICLFFFFLYMYFFERERATGIKHGQLMLRLFFFF
jgi:hypothetical protein